MTHVTLGVSPLFFPFLPKNKENILYTTTNKIFKNKLLQPLVNKTQIYNTNQKNKFIYISTGKYQHRLQENLRI